MGGRRKTLRGGGGGERLGGALTWRDVIGGGIGGRTGSQWRSAQWRSAAGSSGASVAFKRDSNRHLSIPCVKCLCHTTAKRAHATTSSRLRARMGGGGQIAWLSLSNDFQARLLHPSTTQPTRTGQKKARRSRSRPLPPRCTAPADGLDHPPVLTAQLLKKLRTDGSRGEGGSSDSSQSIALSSSSLSQVLALEGSVRSLAPSLGAVPAGSPPQTGA